MIEEKDLAALTAQMHAIREEIARLQGMIQACKEAGARISVQPDQVARISAFEQKIEEMKEQWTTLLSQK